MCFKITYLLTVYFLMDIGYSQNDSYDVDLISISPDYTEKENCNWKVCEIKNQCSYENTCPDICANIETTDPSLTVMSVECGKMMFLKVQLTTGKLSSVFENHYPSKGKKQILYSADDHLVWIQENELRAKLKNVKQPELDIEGLKLIVGYDACDLSLYSVDNSNQLKLIQSSGDEIFLNFSFSNVISACIDFQNNNIYTTEYTAKIPNNYVIKRANVEEFKFENIFNFTAPAFFNAIMKINSEGNRLLLAFNRRILIVDIDEEIAIASYDVNCVVSSADLDSTFAYFTCEDWTIISKFDYVRKTQIENLTDAIFEGTPFIILTASELCLPSITTVANRENLVLPTLPTWQPWPVWVGGFVGGFVLLLIVLIIVMYLCWKRWSNDERRKVPPLPPGFERVRISGNVYEEGPYTEIDPYEATPKVDPERSEDLEDPKRLLGSNPESTYLYLVDPQYIEAASTPTTAVEGEKRVTVETNEKEDGDVVTE